jgi:hypothetical protein
MRAPRFLLEMLTSQLQAKMKKNATYRTHTNAQGQGTTARIYSRLRLIPWLAAQPLRIIIIIFHGPCTTQA